MIFKDEDAYEKMECLLRHGADPDWQMGYHLIDQVPVTRNSFMFSFQAPQYQRYFHRQTVLHRIVKNYLSQKISFDSALPMIKLLSQYHAQFDLVDAKGKTALQLLRDAQAQIYADVGYFEKPVNKQEMKYLIQLIQNLSIEKKPQTPGAAIHELENNLREELLSTVFADFEEDSIEGMLDTLVGASLGF